MSNPRTPFQMSSERSALPAPGGKPLIVHQHLCGVLHRIGFVAKMLDLLLARDDTVFMTGAEICDWYLAAEP